MRIITSIAALAVLAASGAALAEGEIVNPQITDAVAPEETEETGTADTTEDAFPTSVNNEEDETSFPQRRTPGVYMAEDEDETSPEDQTTEDLAAPTAVNGAIVDETDETSPEDQTTEDLAAPTAVNGAIVDSTTMKTPVVYIDGENAFPNEEDETDEDAAPTEVNGQVTD